MLGVCYYPEHWPEHLWADDAKQMRALGLNYVRVGEFAWSRLEPAAGQLHFEWLDRAIDILSGEGLHVVLGIPTATPPKWLIDQYPDILPVDPVTGDVRGFGSRRHYDFSSEMYLQQSRRITRLLATRYARHDGVAGWQTDNELCCHDTALSASPNVLAAFRQWCQRRYGDIKTLNTQWGNVFWSMEYSDFSDIELPLAAVTETNPAHRLAYRRFSSDQVTHFHEQMVKTIREYAPGKFITHNFIPMPETGVDNIALASALDFVSYDNYPLGRTDLYFANEDARQMQRYMRTGHPDFATYYLDQSRGLSRGDFWVMEQQPGPVNWAEHNPRPAPGMVRLWTLEAFAHGAACVSYFRWRQVPFAQEQMHSGLLRTDHSKTEAWPQIEQTQQEVVSLALLTEHNAAASVAIVTDVLGQWVCDIERQAASYDFNRVQFDYYRALRQLGVNVDFISTDASLSQYAIVIVPCLPIISDKFIQECQRSNALCVFGPRSGAKTDEFSLPANLPPGVLQQLITIKVLSTETLRPPCSEHFEYNGKHYQSIIWREEIQAAQGTEVLAHYHDGGPAVVRSGNTVYIATLTDVVFLQEFFTGLCEAVGVKVYELPEGIRLRQRGTLMFAFNYSNKTHRLPVNESTHFLLGQRLINPCDVSIWKL